MLDAKLFDHTILKADATTADVKAVCREAVQYGFRSVCVNGCHTALVRAQLEGSGVKVCTVVGFPLGQMSTAAKCEEARLAVADGAEEIDMVINVGAIKERNDNAVEAEIAAVSAACQPALLKVIIEAGLLTDEEKRCACRLAEAGGADFVKTSTGFSAGGATYGDVVLMKGVVGDRLGVKASGGIRDTERAEEMVRAGADRLGTSNTVSIYNTCMAVPVKSGDLDSNIL